MADRRPLFELHIRPMFRTIDAVHMLRLPPQKRVDLTSYDDVKAHHQDIGDFLKAGSPMPPKSVGGPWPAEWISLFVRWRDTGFGRLVKPAGSNFRLALTAPDRFTLNCEVALPDATSTAWFDIVAADAASQIYEAVAEQPEGGPPAPATVTIEERIRGPLTVAEVIVRDSAGEHRLAIPTA